MGPHRNVVHRVHVKRRHCQRHGRSALRPCLLSCRPRAPHHPRRIWLLLMLLYVVVDDGYPVVQASFGMELLLWVASVASQPENAQRTLVGHGGSGNAETFTFGLAKYMLVTRSMADVSPVLFRILC